jgi:hypothetical protein
MNELGFSTNLAGKFKLAGTLPGILPPQKNSSEQIRTARKTHLAEHLRRRPKGGTKYQKTGLVGVVRQKDHANQVDLRKSVLPIRFVPLLQLMLRKAPIKRTK